ncbi:hypothetical protein B0H11DRAFT_1931521 [Mycena galericulata]|nr:hypothetical protein B0H11DRAFT_1931521 [Mycena galericulata]
MSFSLPMDVLSSMQISCKVGLPDGIFAFDMVPSKTPATMDVQPQDQSGMKLNILATRESSGVTLTLFTTCVSAPSADSASEDILVPSFDVNSPYGNAGVSGHSSQANMVTDSAPLDQLLETFNRTSTDNNSRSPPTMNSENQFTDFDFPPYSDLAAGFQRQPGLRLRRVFPGHEIQQYIFTPFFAVLALRTTTLDDASSGIYYPLQLHARPSPPPKIFLHDGLRHGLFAQARQDAARGRETRSHMFLTIPQYSARKQALAYSYGNTNIED